MKPSLIFILFLLLAAVFLFFSSAPLPPVVASHFAAGGRPNGFMPRHDYLVFMYLTTIGAPLAIAGLAFLLRVIPDSLVNMPNRKYWLAPERREETRAYLENHLLFFAGLLAIFLCFIHWLLVQANLRQPPVLPEPMLFRGLIVFLIVIAGWLIHLIHRFRQAG